MIEAQTQTNKLSPCWGRCSDERRSNYLSIFEFDFTKHASKLVTSSLSSISSFTVHAIKSDFCLEKSRKALKTLSSLNFPLFSANKEAITMQLWLRNMDRRELEAEIRTSDNKIRGKRNFPDDIAVNGYRIRRQSCLGALALIFIVQKRALKLNSTAQIKHLLKEKRGHLQPTLNGA